MKEELFTIKPNLHQFYGRTLKKDTEFDEYTEDKTVHQTLKDLVMTTEVNNESEFNGIKSVETSKMVQTFPEGTVLIWDEQQGYIVPHVQMCTLNEITEEIAQLEEIYK